MIISTFVTKMSTLITHLLVILLCASSISSNDDFENYIRVFKKTYRTATEVTMRREVYLKNKQFIGKFNAEQAQLIGFRMGENHLTDLSGEEIAIRSGARVPEKLEPDSRREMKSKKFLEDLLNLRSYSDIPDELDWRKVPGRVSEVRDQGPCGSDWAFSATGALEGQMMLNSSEVGYLVKLSEQNLIDCSESNDGCSGGIMWSAWLDIMSSGGIESERDYPYTGIDGNCKFSKAKSIVRDVGYRSFETGLEEILKILVATYGPVSVMVDAAHESFRHYSGGIYYERNCRSDAKYLNHALLIVGYGIETETYYHYWIAKNSWGTQWGENGYIRLARDWYNNCGVASQIMLPILE